MKFVAVIGICHALSGSFLVDMQRTMKVDNSHKSTKKGYKSISDM